MESTETNTNPTKLDLAAQRWRDAKTREIAAREDRLMAEQDIIEVMGHKEEGAQVSTSEYFKVTTTGKLTRSIDADKLAAVQSAVPTYIFERVINYTPKVNTRELKYIRQNEPELYKYFATAITVKPAKTAVKVETL